MRESTGPLPIERVSVTNLPFGREGDLLLEERWEHQSGATSVLEALDRIEVQP